MEPVEGPRRTSSSSSCRRPQARPDRSRRFSVGRGGNELHGQFEGQAADLLFGVFDHHLEHALLDRSAAVRLKVTGQPAQACRPRAASSSAWATEMGPWGRRPRGSPFRETGCAGAARNPGISSMLHVVVGAGTMASIAVCRLHRLGPRSARMRETSMDDSPCLFSGRPPGRGAGCISSGMSRQCGRSVGRAAAADRRARRG